MKAIGVVGGMSWESSKEYYIRLNQIVRERLGGLHSAKIIMYSIDFVDLEENQRGSDWRKATEIITDVSKKLEGAGADFIVICSNTGHEGADIVDANINIPVLNIIDVTAKEVRASGLKKVGLLGTKYTMQKGFYRGRMACNYEVETLLPNTEDCKIVNDIIYEELCVGKIKKSSKEEYKRVIKDLVDRGAEGIVLGCTEIPLLVQQKDCSVPVFDGTEIHIRSAVDFALSEEKSIKEFLKC